MSLPCPNPEPERRAVSPPKGMTGSRPERPRIVVRGRSDGRPKIPDLSRRLRQRNQRPTPRTKWAGVVGLPGPHDPAERVGMLPVAIPVSVADDEPVSEESLDVQALGPRRESPPLRIAPHLLDRLSSDEHADRFVVLVAEEGQHGGRRGDDDIERNGARVFLSAVGGARVPRPVFHIWTGPYTSAASGWASSIRTWSSKVVGPGRRRHPAWRYTGPVSSSVPGFGIRSCPGSRVPDARDTGFCRASPGRTVSRSPGSGRRIRPPREEAPRRGRSARSRIRLLRREIFRHSGWG